MNSRWTDLASNGFWSYGAVYVLYCMTPWWLLWCVLCWRQAWQHDNIERVAVHVATVEELVAAEETYPKDNIRAPNPQSVPVTIVPHALIRRVQVRFWVDSLGQFRGVDIVACQSDLAGITFPDAMETCLYTQHVAGGDQDGQRDDTKARHDTYR